MPEPPNEAVLEKFAVQVIAPLGGRLNQHWLVASRQEPKERFVLRRWHPSADTFDYELRLLKRIAALGWPVAPALEDPFTFDGRVWSLFPFLPGDPPSEQDPLLEQRARGRLLAQFHADLASLQAFGQRGNWRRCEQILSDTTLDAVLTDHEHERPEEIRILRWHLDRARTRIAGLELDTQPGIIVHGDFTQWNLRFHNGHLCGIMDFELAHWDHRVGDFALSWRGRYDAVIAGYEEVSPLAPYEWALLTPLWWAQLIEGFCHDLRHGLHDDGWTLKKLLQRSPLMGVDAVPFR